MIRNVFSEIVFFLLVFTGFSSAETTYFVAPLGAPLSETADGSAEKPWPSLNAAFSNGAVTGGDTILLLDGDFGKWSLSKKRFETPVTIRSLNGKNAHVESIYIKESKNIIFENLSVWNSNPYLGESVGAYAAASTSDIIFDGLDLRGGEDARSYMDWTAEEWSRRSLTRVHLGGPNSILRNSVLVGAGAAITTRGVDAQVYGNRVEGFTADAMRGLADRNTFKNNYVINSMNVSNNHDDGFQSWADADGALDGLVISGNVFIEWAGNPDHPLRGRMQGIGLFDGFYDNLIIENNVVAVSQYHGLSVYGGRNVTIINNTVVNNDGVVGGSPWLGVFSHKNGTPPTNIVVANNLAMSFKGGGSLANNITFTDNAVIISPEETFENIGAFDFTPKFSGNVIDTANSNFVPAVDVYNNPRPFGDGPDKGAIEAGSTGGTLSLAPDSADGAGDAHTNNSNRGAGKWVKINDVVKKGKKFLKELE